MAGTDLRAGAARIDITPELGTHLAGDGAGRHRPARRIAEPIFANALVLESKDRRAAILSMDLLAITREYTEKIRRRAADKIGCEPGAIIVHVTQNHAAPSAGPLMWDPGLDVVLSPETEYLAGSESAYCEFAVERAVEALAQACGALEPVKIGWGRAVTDSLAFNRRAVMRDGAIGMPWPFSSKDQPFGPVNVSHLEGPVDPEVAVAGFQARDGHLVALLLHHSCHPVNVFARDKYVLSGDWPGVWGAGMIENTDERTVPIVLNGCCGNINPWPAFVPDFIPNHVRMGGELKEIGMRILSRMTFSDPSELSSLQQIVSLDYRDVPEARLTEVDKILSEYPEVLWDEVNECVDRRWFYAASTRSIELCKTREPEFLYEIQVLRIGDMAVVAWPGEPFVEGQLELKIRSPAACLFVAHMCTQYVGYVPTAEAARRGGHEAAEFCPYWAKLASDSLDRIVHATGSMIEELFQ